MIDPGLLTDIRRDHERRGLLRSTIEKRHIQMKALGRWMGTRSIWDATEAEIEAFLDGRGLCARSRYSWLAGLHCVYAWGIDNGYTRADPTARIVRPRLRRQLPRPIPTADLRTALRSASAVMRCWLLLGAYQGLRCQEIAGLRREDVLEGEGLLRVVHAKGRYERMLPLHPAVRAAIGALPHHRSGWLFERPQGGPFTPNRVSTLIADHLREHGATAHQLRHWFASELYSGTHDLRLVQEMLGHATPQSTAIYTAFDHLAARDAVGALTIDVPLDAA